MRTLIIMLLVLLNVYSCSHKYYCTRADNGRIKSDEVELIGVIHKSNEIQIEVKNMSTIPLYIPDHLGFNCGNEGVCFMDNDVFITSMEIPIKIREIKPGEVAKLIYINKEEVSIFNTLRLQLIYVLSEKELLMKKDFSNFNLLTFSDNNIRELNSHLFRCNK